MYNGLNNVESQYTLELLTTVWRLENANDKSTPQKIAEKGKGYINSRGWNTIQWRNDRTIALCLCALKWEGIATSLQLNVQNVIYLNWVFVVCSLYLSRTRVFSISVFTCVLLSVRAGCVCSLASASNSFQPSSSHQISVEYLAHLDMTRKI